MFTLGFTQEPGRPYRLRGENSGGHRATNVQVCRRMASAPCGSEKMNATAVIAKRRKTKCGETGDRES
jgi:hypothetical protein